MLREKEDYFEVTDEGKKEFALHSTASTSNATLVAVGIVLIAFTLLLEWEIAPLESVAGLGVLLIFLGAFLSMLTEQTNHNCLLALKCS